MRGLPLDPEFDGEWVDSTCVSELSGPSATCGPSTAHFDEPYPPLVAISAPDDGAMLLGPEARADVEVFASDGGGVAVTAVELLVDGPTPTPGTGSDSTSRCRTTF